MEINEKDILTVTNRQQLRAWLKQHCQTATVAWTYYSLKPQPGKLLYLDLVEEALCFGWIDGLAKRHGDSLIRRLTPRQPGSHWSQLNRARVQRLTKLGLMTKAGLAAVPEDDFMVDPRVAAAIAEDKTVAANYQQFPELYKRIRIDNIQDALRTHHEKTFQKRLAKFVLYTKFDLMYGSWNDNGRLLK